MINCQSITNLCQFTLNDESTLYQQKFKLKDKIKVVHLSQKDSRTIQNLVQAIREKNIDYIYYAKNRIPSIIYNFLRDYFLEQTEDFNISKIL